MSASRSLSTWSSQSVFPHEGLMAIRALIVDDEPLAREAIRELLGRDPEIQVVAECGDGRQAVSAIQKLRPELVFLDIQMPDVDGFSVIEAVGAARMPVTIFVTAYDRYALKAFDVNALDYVLKPFDEERFQKAVDRAKSQLKSDHREQMEQRLGALLRDVRPAQPFLDRLVIKSSGRILFLRTPEIDWIQAEGNYLRLHVGKDSYLFRETMNNIERKLDGRRFVRIHRSTIVNVERIKELHPWHTGEYVVMMQSGKELTLSRGYRHQLDRLLGKAS